MTPLETILLIYATCITAGWISRECSQVVVEQGAFWAGVWFLILSAFHVGLLAVTSAMVSLFGIVGRSVGPWQF